MNLVFGKYQQSTKLTRQQFDLCCLELFGTKISTDFFNSNNSMSFTDFSQIVKQQQIQTAHNQIGVLKQIPDMNVTEFAAFCSQFQINSDEAVGIFEILDQNKTGRVNWEDFYRFV
ncbi:EF-hand_domain pair [Hexamita inflata]|uniref:EF-hand domain pair n=1 Tax=Hexamita inflata TaxID=28002 RepID=A0AA86U0Q2_9EUKA|nr:EF-hand domain pair [Hexamita inflata]